MRNVNPEYRWLKRLAVALSMSLSWAALAPSAQAETGEELFKRTCAACHTVGGGRLVGPDLAGVTERRSKDWIASFVVSSKAMIDSGDEAAVAIFEEYSRIQMPDQPLTAAQVSSVIEYIESGGTPAATAAAPAPEPAAEPTQADVELGRALFQGTARLENGGPTCNSCHDVVHDDIIGGGLLARDLTTVFSRLGGPGVRAIIGSPPFPVMQRGYEDRPLTPSEVTALVAFLQTSDRDHLLQQPRDYGPKLALSGGVGSALLLGLYTVFWNRRRRTSVNQQIYDRQITSSN